MSVISLARISQRTLGLTFVVILVGMLAGFPDPVSVAGGSALMLANLHLLRFLVSVLIRPGLGPRAHLWVLSAMFLKVALAVALVAAVLYQFPVEPMAFAVGSTTLLVAAVWEAVAARVSEETNAA